jgi:hypothetical protein
LTVVEVFFEELDDTLAELRVRVFVIFAPLIAVTDDLTWTPLITEMLVLVDEVFRLVDVLTIFPAVDTRAVLLIFFNDDFDELFVLVKALRGTSMVLKVVSPTSCSDEAGPFEAIGRANSSRECLRAQGC